jgi:hypothetical protein
MAGTPSASATNPSTLTPIRDLISIGTLLLAAREAAHRIRRSPARDLDIGDDDQYPESRSEGGPPCQTGKSP